MQFVAFDDFEDPVAGACCSQRDTRSLITGICEDALNERKQGSRTRIKHECCAIAIMSAQCTAALNSRPSVSTRMWRFLPLIFFPAS